MDRVVTPRPEREPRSMTSEARLREIAEIIKRVDDRCMAVDGPVTTTLQEMRQPEISRIYELADAPRQQGGEPIRSDSNANRLAWLANRMCGAMVNGEPIDDAEFRELRDLANTCVGHPEHLAARITGGGA